MNMNTSFMHNYSEVKAKLKGENLVAQRYKEEEYFR